MATKKVKSSNTAPTPKWGRVLTKEELIEMLKKIYPDWKPNKE